MLAYLKTREGKLGLLPFTLYNADEGKTPIFIDWKHNPKNIVKFDEKVWTEDFPHVNQIIQLHFSNGITKNSGIIQKVVHTNGRFWFIETVTNGVMLVHYVGE